MNSAEIKTVLAFDYGKKRIGVAVGQTALRTAQALTVLTRKSNQTPWRAIRDLVDEWQPKLFVIGFPHTADGELGPVHHEIESFAKSLSEEFTLPTVFCDERLSSYAASESPRAKKIGLDAIAAECILLTWLESGPNTTQAGS